MTSWIALALSVAALGFTCYSFWWIHASPGKLDVSTPRTFSGSFTISDVLVGLPLVFYATGGRTIVVEDLRLVIPGTEPPKALLWQSRVPKLADAEGAHAAAFAVQGRQAVEMVATFGAKDLGWVTEPGERVVYRLEYRDLHGGWQPLGAFPIVTPRGGGYYPRRVDGSDR